jgi:uncharacterized phosphosugar-binding protein
MLAIDYLNQIRALFERIEQTQMDKINAAADMIADSMATGGALHIFDTGHMLNQELVNRVGGFMALAPLTFGINVNDPVPVKLQNRPREADLDPALEQIRVALRLSNIRRGDSLIIGTVSGRTPNVIEMAIAAREMGVKVIALTSLQYSSQVTSKHPSGKRLFEVADIALDNCGVLGDACMEVPGLHTKALPTSGIGAATVAWCLMAQTMEKLLERGVTPHIFMSANLDEGPAFNEKEKAECDKEGV